MKLEIPWMKCASHFTFHMRRRSTLFCIALRVSRREPKISNFPYVSDVGALGVALKRYIQHCLHIISCTTRGYEREEAEACSRVASEWVQGMRSRVNNIWPECVYINFCGINLHSVAPRRCSYNVVSCSYSFCCKCCHSFFLASAAALHFQISL